MTTNAIDLWRGAESRPDGDELDTHTHTHTQVLTLVLDAPKLRATLEADHPQPGDDTIGETGVARGDPGFRPDPTVLAPIGPCDRARRNPAALDVLP